jgi:hypothetical protein
MEQRYTTTINNLFKSWGFGIEAENDSKIIAIVATVNVSESDKGIKSLPMPAVWSNNELVIQSDLYLTVTDTQYEQLFARSDKHKQFLFGILIDPEVHYFEKNGHRLARHETTIINLPEDIKSHICKFFNDFSTEPETIELPNNRDTRNMHFKKHVSE